MAQVVTIALGTKSAAIGLKLFTAPHELEIQGVDVIFTEAISAFERSTAVCSRAE